MSSQNKHPGQRTYDLADRLVRFSVMISQMTDSIADTREGANIKNQLIRSSSSSALNYGEAQVAESKADFIHKMGICLKELKETRVAIKLISDRTAVNKHKLIQECESECSELVAIFVSSIQTAKKNMRK